MGRVLRVRMAKAWQGSFNTAIVNVAPTQVNVLQSVESAGLNQTLLRSRGQLLIQVTPDAASDIGLVGLGLIVVSENAATVGGTSLPGLLSDIDADWLWYEFVPMDAIILTVADANARAIVHRVDIDARAMRKVAGDKVVVLMAQLSSTSGFASVAVQAGVRFLFGH